MVAPIALAILNPIGFIMMELQKTLNSGGQGGGFLKATVKVLKEVALNPVVNMTVVGIVFNFILDGSLPGLVDNIFLVLGESNIYLQAILNLSLLQ